MKRDLPRPDQILEELADKTAAQIERLAPVAFDGAWSEMTRYHRFLLALNASRTPDGAPFNYAEVPGDAWHAPHRDWIRQYRRLFERAADRIPDDDHFIRSLAYAPIRLLPGSSDPELPPNIVKAILDLGPMMMHRLESWVTKRTTLETPKGQSAEPRLTLAGSDAKAYANVLPELVGAWESLLQRAASIYHWREGSAHGEIERWSAFRASWPFLWQHLTNSAYCLAVAVWNEDEAGAAQFREVLVRWPQALGHRLDGHAHLRHRPYLSPEVLALDWPEASARAAPLAYDYMPAPTPDQLFASIVRGAHDDALLLIAGLLLFWTINDKQASDIGGRTARALLRREGGNEDGHGSPGKDLSLRSLFLDLLRFEMAGERYGEGSYAADLDRLVEVLDNMTERRVVPGRVFTPSTLHGRDDLLLSFVAILAVATPDEGDDGLAQRIAELAREEEVLPGGDRSLRNIVHELGRFRSTLEQPWPQLARGIAALAPGRDADRVIGRLREIVSSAEATVEAERLQRLKDRPIDPAKLERIRSAVEVALLKGPAEAPFFRDVRIERAARDDPAEWREVVFNGISKAQLVDPAMESPISGFEESFVSGSQEVAGRHAWAAFTRRPRIQMNVGAKAEDEEFWREIATLIEQVGPDPVLVLSRTAEGRALRRFGYGAVEPRPNLSIEQRARGERAGSYIVTVEGVDVFGADFPAGVAWLFSGQALQRIRYAELDAPSRYIDIVVEMDEGIKGTLRVRFRQQVDWTDTPIFELTAPDTDNLEDGGVPNQPTS